MSVRTILARFLSTGKTEMVVECRQCGTTSLRTLMNVPGADWKRLGAIKSRREFVTGRIK